jgi:uncharacterized protein YvpB
MKPGELLHVKEVAQVWSINQKPIGKISNNDVVIFISYQEDKDYIKVISKYGIGEINIFYFIVD